jgi:peptidoglycan/LPS O-acetylase OafA/YrhL
MLAAMGNRLAELLFSFPTRFSRKISQGAYRPEIDGLRFFAISFVIIGHSLERAARFFASYRDRVEGGALEHYLQLAPLGVYLFFAISGFILANQALKAKASPLSGEFLRSYYLRRVLRIEPPYILLLLATWALITLTGWSPEGTRHFDAEPHSLNLSLIGSVFYVHDLLWGTFPRLFPPGWSLEVEVQFYLLAPLLFAVWAAMRFTWERALLAALFAATGLNLALWNPSHIGPFDLTFSLLRHFQYFWVGIVLAFFREPVAAAVARLPGPAATLIGWGGLALCIALPPPAQPDDFLREAARLIAVYLGLAAMFASTFAPRSGFRAFCAAPWISLIGGACYSIYLVHLQVIQVVTSLAGRLAPNLPLAGVGLVLLVSTAAVLAVGLAYYVEVERRFMTKNWHLLARDYVLARLGRSARAPAAAPTSPLAASRRSAAARP